MQDLHLYETGSVPSDLIDLYETHAKKYGISVPLLRLLQAVYLHPGCTQKALCEQLRLSKQRVHCFVRELGQKKLLSLSANENDGRSRLLHVTGPGGAVIEELFHTLDFHTGNAPAPETHTHVLPDGTVISHTHGEQEHGHSHTHTKAVLDRLARSIGHLEKVRRMVESGADCSEVLIQLSAVKAAVNSTGKLILKDHIEHCLVDAIEHGDRQTVQELNRAIDQFIK